MPFVEFNESDLLRNKLVVPAWYRVSFDSVGEWKPSKNATSNNLEIEATIIKNADNGDEEFTGVPVTFRMNDHPKMKPSLETLLKCTMGETIEKGRYAIEAVVGKEVEVFIANKTWEGRVSNDVTMKYRPVSEKRGVAQA